MGEGGGNGPDRERRCFLPQRSAPDRLLDRDRKSRIISSSSPLRQVLSIITPERLIKTAAFSSRCSAVVSEPLNSKVVKCVRHLIRLKCNPLRGKQLIWLIILLYLLTLHSSKILDLNTQTAWGRSAWGLVRLVVAEKCFKLHPSLGFMPDLVFVKGSNKNTQLMRQPSATEATFGAGLRISYSRSNIAIADATDLHFN